VIFVIKKGKMQKTLIYVLLQLFWLHFL